MTQGLVKIEGTDFGQKFQQKGRLCTFLRVMCDIGIISSPSGSRSANRDTTTQRGQVHRRLRERETLAGSDMHCLQHRRHEERVRGAEQRSRKPTRLGRETACGHIEGPARAFQVKPMDRRLVLNSHPRRRVRAGSPPARPGRAIAPVASTDSSPARLALPRVWEALIQREPAGRPAASARCDGPGLPTSSANKTSRHDVGGPDASTAGRAKSSRDAEQLDELFVRICHPSLNPRSRRA